MTSFALIFDFDGLILDTEVPLYEAWRRRYQDHGFELTIETWGVCLGTGENVLDPCGNLEKLTGLCFNRDELTLQHRAHVLEQLATAGPLAGVVRLLDQARDLGVRIGLASSSPREWVTSHLERLGILDRFETIRTCEDVKRTKPDPELFQRVLDDFGLQAHQAVVLEDSTNGIRAANAAGIYVIAVPNGLTRHLDLTGADLIVDSLELVELEELIQTLIS